ncbi:hypothetical protein Mal64_18720 [Pseudobythopirellula maris]|uniref:Plasmid stabilization system protein n=1 Tax=Pseudobythopirellula maris TaxID=2527991 RepID=A0A5C5ZLR5_9BACT|nr:type II toxin-antitoxin system RelE/ParE family toxin [Pseudobythopirellula maris]TWT88392.1 hypothetical protein Mal64_18720 [Pseudobythopirellula maris]
MNRRIVITEPAKWDIHSNRSWWSVCRSKEQADRWYTGILNEIYSLAEMPERFSFASEHALRIAGVRQMLYGLGGATHRVLYCVEDDAVVIYRVLSARQDSISAEDLE